VTAPLVEARGLTKKFGDFVAVDEIDFEVRPGEVFGFLGPNGAGKSSTMKMIGSVSPVTEGTLRVLGLDPATGGPEIRSRLGVVPQEDNLDHELTVYENLLIYGRYFGMARKVIDERVGELLAFAQLEERRNSTVEPLSGGMKRRLTIARGLINQPELLLLDEPTTGLDPQARHLLWDRLYRLKQEGVTQIITTHYMDDEHSNREVLELRFPVGAQDRGIERIKDLAARIEELPDRVLLYTDDADRTALAVTERGVVPEATVTRRSTLEDVFLRLTGRRLVD